MAIKPPSLYFSFIFMDSLFSSAIHQWYKINKRDLPWRNLKDPYIIWLSEIILQQTRVAQGLPYFNKFVAAYPTVFDLAHAPQDEVLRLWQGLGYYSRARNLHGTAQVIVSKYNGIFPSSYSHLLKLKGVGQYTAAAIASFAFDEDVAVVDGNVYRVLARYFGIETDINSGKGQKDFKQLAQQLLPKGLAAEHNQGIMEFGALQCVPVSPDCSICPLNETCVAFLKKEVSQLPIKINKTKIKQRYFSYHVFLKDRQLFLHKRETNDIWQGLYNFHLLEGQDFVSPTEGVELFVSKEYNHILTHQRIKAKFFVIDAESIEKLPDFLSPFSEMEIENLPKPVLISKFLNDYASKIFN